MLKAVHPMVSRGASGAKAAAVAGGLDSMGLGEAVRTVREGCAEAPACTRFPRERWRRIRADSAVERLDREIRRRARLAPSPTTRAPPCS